MDFKDFMNLSNSAESLSGILLYILAGIGILLLILLIVWLLFKLSALIRQKKGHTIMKEKPTDEEELFGE